MRRIRQEGHQIGSHSFSHRALTELSTADALADLEKCDRALRQVLGDGSYWLRPPYGFLSDRELCALGTPAICWSVDTEDWKSRDVDSILDIVLRRAGDGDILLLHDCYATSVTAALEIVDRLQPRGVPVRHGGGAVRRQGSGARLRDPVPPGAGRINPHFVQNDNGRGARRGI